MRVGEVETVLQSIGELLDQLLLELDGPSKLFLGAARVAQSRADSAHAAVCSCRLLLDLRIRALLFLEALVEVQGILQEQAYHLFHAWDLSE